MSFNLYLSEGEDGQKIDLWQTPTWVTMICMSYNPETGEPDGGHEAVRRRYIEWVKSHTYGKWDSLEDLEWEHERIQIHVKKVLSVKNPFFYYL